MRRDLGFDECPECGGHDLETDTTAPEGEAQDGDSVLCRECGQTGNISCDSETIPYVNWHDEVVCPKCALVFDPQENP